MHRTGFPVRLCKVSPKPSRARWHLPGWCAQACCFPVLRRGVGAGARGVWAGWAHSRAPHTSLGGRCSEGGHGCCQKQLGLAALCLAGPHKPYCIKGGWLGLTSLGPAWPSLRKTEQVFPLFRLLRTWSASSSKGGELCWGGQAALGTPTGELPLCLPAALPQQTNPASAL